MIPTKKQLYGIDLIMNNNIVILDGAVRSGKTWTALWAVPYLIKKHWSENILFSAKTLANIERNILAPLRKIYGSSHIGYIKDKKDVEIFGKTVWLIAFVNEASFERLQGTSLGCAIMDEAVLCPESYWNMLLTRLDIEDFNLVASCNPSSPAHYFKKYIDNESIQGKVRLHWTIEDNPHLPKMVIENLKASYKDNPTFYKRYILGEWVSTEGLACYAFDREIHYKKKSEIGDYKRFLSRAKTLIVGVDGAVNNDKTSLTPMVFNENDDCLVFKRFNHNPKTTRIMSNIEQVQQLIKPYINELMQTELFDLPSYVEKIMVVDCAAADLIIHLRYAFEPLGWVIIALTKKDIKHTLEIMNNSFSKNKIVIIDYEKGDYDYLMRIDSGRDYLIEELETVELREITDTTKRDRVELNPKYPNDSFDTLRYAVSYYYKVEDMSEED